MKKKFSLMDVFIFNLVFVIVEVFVWINFCKNCNMLIESKIFLLNISIMWVLFFFDEGDVEFFSFLVVSMGFLLIELFVLCIEMIVFFFGGVFIILWSGLSFLLGIIFFLIFVFWFSVWFVGLVLIVVLVEVNIFCGVFWVGNVKVGFGIGFIKDGYCLIGVGCLFGKIFGFVLYFKFWIWIGCCFVGESIILWDWM